MTSAPPATGPGQPVVSPAASLLNLVSVVLRLAQVHDATNAVLGPPIIALVRAIGDLEAEGEVRVDLVAESFFVNKSLVRVPQGLAESADNLRKTFSRLQIQRLAMSPTLTEAELRAFVEQFQRHWRTPTPQRLKEEPPGPVRVAALGSAGDEGGLMGVSIDARQHLLKCYARLVVLAQEAVARVQAGGASLPPQTRRAAQALIDASKGRERLLTGLTRFPGFRGDLGGVHAAVAAHCLVMGRALGLSKATLVDVVLAALQHRLGAAAPSLPLGDGNAESHAVAARTLVAVLAEGVTPSTGWWAAAAFEAGLPVWHRDLFAPGVLARLMAVPMAFEQLTTPRPPEPAVTPDQALALIKEQTGTRFDADVVALFTSIIGIYPIGSLVRLDDGSLAVVVDFTSRPSRPLVRLVRTPQGAASHLLDLSLEPGRSIAGVAEPSEVQVNPTFFLLA